MKVLEVNLKVVVPFDDNDPIDGDWLVDAVFYGGIDDIPCCLEPLPNVTIIKEKVRTANEEEKKEFDEDND
jgi:hypothetical protein